MYCDIGDKAMSPYCKTKILLLKFIIDKSRNTKIWMQILYQLTQPSTAKEHKSSRQNLRKSRKILITFLQTTPSRV
jgi:hypothetical protein